MCRAEGQDYPPVEGEVEASASNAKEEKDDYFQNSRGVLRILKTIKCASRPARSG